MTDRTHARLAWDVFVGATRADRHRRSAARRPTADVVADLGVDPLMTTGQARALAEWVAATGRNLMTTCIAGTTRTARELYDQVLALDPSRVNSGALWASARALRR
jgi:hypothetical protein